jgi:hypothetical protein
MKFLDGELLLSLANSGAGFIRTRNFGAKSPVTIVVRARHVNHAGMKNITANIRRIHNEGGYVRFDFDIFSKIKCPYKITTAVVYYKSIPVYTFRYGSIVMAKYEITGAVDLYDLASCFTNGVVPPDFYFKK